MAAAAAEEVGCEECQRWMEHYHWKHKANYFRFINHLTGDFSSQLAIPKSFLTGFLKGRQIIHSVGLRVSGCGERRVEMANLPGGSIAFYGFGWKEFVGEHSLEEGDTLLFTYDDNEGGFFDVRIFEPLTGGEKVSSYFPKGSSKEGARRRKPPLLLRVQPERKGQAGAPLPRSRRKSLLMLESERKGETEGERPS